MPARLRHLPALLIVVLGATLVVHAQIPAQPPIPKGTNVLLGRVLDMSGDTPIGGALVTLIGFFDAAGKPVSAIPQGLTAQVSQGRSIMTTGDGFFVFQDLPAGRYTVAVRALGYAIVNFGQVIEVTDNEKPSPIPVRLWKYAAIGGRVVDERGEPVVGMHVNALRRSTSSGGVVITRAGTGVTDDRGIYRIAQLTPGDYVVGVLSTTTTMPASVAGAMESSAANSETYMAVSSELRQSGLFRSWGTCEGCWASSSDGQRYGNLVLQRLGPAMPLSPGGQPLGFANSMYPGTPSIGDATVIALGSGESRTGIDVPIRFVATLKVSGVVTGPGGPMKHLVVRLAPPGANLNDFDPPGISIAVTDAQGAFTILGVTPGAYTLSAVFAAPADQTGAVHPFWAARQLTVGDADVAGLAIPLQPGVKVGGRVDFRSASASRPTQRMQVTLSGTRAMFWRSFPQVVQPDGTFETFGDPPGRYSISAPAPGGWYWQSTTLGGKPLADEVVDLGVSDLTGLVLTFGQATNGVSGTVTDTSGSPDTAAAVVVFPADANAAWRDGIFTTRRVRVVNVTTKGAYEIATLAPGEYYLAAVNMRQPLNWREPQVLERLIPGATRVTLGVEDTKSVSLKSIPLPVR